MIFYLKLAYRKGPLMAANSIVVWTIGRP